MSDVTVAPNATPAAPAAPAANEVVINPNPASSPQPVGAQAPDKPVGDIKGSEHRPQSRREAIQAAFKRASEAQNAKPREAKIGDNNPPEKTEREKPARPKPEPVDLKKRPDQQPNRGEHGH